MWVFFQCLFDPNKGKSEDLDLAVFNPLSQEEDVSMSKQNDLYNNQINAHTLIGQSAMVYCASKLMEKWRKEFTCLWLVIHEFSLCSTNILCGLSTYKPLTCGLLLKYLHININNALTFNLLIWLLESFLESLETVFRGQWVKVNNQARSR